MALQVILQLLLPALFTTSLWRRRFQSMGEWLLNVLVVCLFLGFVFVTARWDFFSYYLRFLPWPIFVLASALSYRRMITCSSAVTPKPHEVRFVMDSVLLFGLIWLNIEALSGCFYSGEAVSLSFPLWHGVYYVGAGGTNHWLNAHRADDESGNDYALDIVRLNAFGRTTTFFPPTDLRQYAIFGDTVYSPCDGVVITAVDGLPDLLPPQKDTENLAGNHLVIANGDAHIVLAHLMQGSLRVKAGDTVSEGQVLGRVGNSGKTRQPHLHIHAARNASPVHILSGEGVPILCEGKFLVRNDVFTGK